MASSIREAARRTAIYVRNMRVTGHAQPRRRAPRPRWPIAVEREYAAALVAIVNDLRAQVTEVMRDVPALLETARQARQDAAQLLERIGLRILVENPAGSVRRWVDSDGTAGETVMRFDYGEIDGFLGADGEDVDVYLGPVADPLLVYVIHQRCKSSGFTEYDEDKVMLGWDSADDAVAAYLAQYDDPRFFGGMSSFTIEDFKRRLATNPGQAITHEPMARETREDIGEGRRGRALLDRVRESGGVTRAARRAEQASETIARRTGDQHRQDLGRQTSAALGVDITPLLADPKMGLLVEGFIAENVALIRSLGNKALDDVEKLVTRAVTEGMRAETLGQLIADRFEIHERHARLIARDQLGKIHGQITRARHRELGIARFRWLTMRDVKVRPRHRPHEGKVYAYEGDGAPPFFPGQEICCRCGEEPVLDDIEAELDALLEGRAPALASASSLAVPPPSNPVRAPRRRARPAAPPSFSARAMGAANTSSTFSPRSLGVSPSPPSGAGGTTAGGASGAGAGGAASGGGGGGGRRRPPGSPAGGGRPPKSPEQLALDAIDAESKLPMATSFHPNMADPSGIITPDRRRAFEEHMHDVFGTHVTLEEVSHGFAVPDDYEARLTGLGHDSITWDIRHKVSGEAATLNRQFRIADDGTPEVYHALFDVPKALQGRGLSDTVNGNALRHYEKWGVKRAAVSAHWVGRYAWSRGGFRFKDPSSVLAAFERFIDRHPVLRARKAEMMAKAAAFVPVPGKLAVWDEAGLLFQDEERDSKNFGQMVPLGRAFLLSHNMAPWGGILPIDRKDAGYLLAIVKNKVHR